MVSACARFKTGETGEVLKGLLHIVVTGTTKEKSSTLNGSRKYILITWRTSFDHPGFSATVWQRSQETFFFFSWSLSEFQIFLTFSNHFSVFFFFQHSPVFCVAKRMTRATMTMKSKETMVMRPISREVQRGFFADLGGLVSVILGSPPSAAVCINSPEGRRQEKGWDD